MTVTIDGTNGLTFPDNSVQSKTGANATNITSGVLAFANGGSNVATIPAFFAARTGTDQTGITAATATKVQLNTKVFDTNSNFDNTTNYRFTPTVAGYYQMSWSAYMFSSTSTSMRAYLYKNGTNFLSGSWMYAPGSQTDDVSTGSGLVYMNGTTDYLELYVYIQSGSSLTVYNGSTPYWTFLSGCLVRGA